MKRLILIGGRPWFAEDKGKAFVETLFRYYPKEVKLAFCIFAQPESDWEETKVVNIEMFDAYKGARNISYQTMSPKNFADVSAWADIIYVPGGSTVDLMARTKPFDLAENWNGKLIAGASAGANFMCEGYVSLSSKTYESGLGWVKATGIPHWRSNYNDYTDKDWDFIEQQALEHAPGTPVLCIPESEFIELTIR